MIKTRFDGIIAFLLIGKILMQMNEHWNSETVNPKYISEIGRNSSLPLYKGLTRATWAHMVTINQRLWMKTEMWSVK